MHGKLLDAYRVQPRRNRHALLPVRDTAAVAEIDRLLQQAVRDDLILRRRRDDELARRLVVRVVDHRQPLPRAVRPVLAERAPLAVFVRNDAQPRTAVAAVRAERRARGRRRNAVVLNREADELAGLRRGRDRQRQPVVRVRERHRRAVAAGARHRHRAAVVRRRQIEHDLTHVVRRESHRDRRLADNLRRRVAQRETKDVVLRVNSGLPRVRIGSD